MHPYLVNLY